jgi:hypothetical protein
MNAEQKKNWKERVVSYFKVLSWHSPGETKEIYGNKSVNTASLEYTRTVPCLEQFLYTNLLGLPHQQAACGLKAVCSLMFRKYPRTF